MKRTDHYLLILTLVLLSLTSAEAQVATGGDFTIERSVIATGGASNLSGGDYQIDGTVGQGPAGTKGLNQTSAHYTGFWTPDQFAPTAAETSVGGRVMTSDGRGIRSVLVILINQNGQMRNAISGPFGYYRFDQVEVGQTYVLQAHAKLFTFAPTVQTVIEELLNLDLIATTAGRERR